ncbi:UvrB/UvrC motif-containing protein [Stieleria sp. JC731]|uniref:UvrB/UvrC motif-containing protein n=1 Tax=Pirellulaceae TaxID=2691357 RepID=UPI001E2CAC46|nr:UvrB/UvrC motif-containing protein [Stieleria sp. JC731]MCC9600524.1 UvrB/UvrC motif-containing protein [Stieleria sp. JC731]
MKCQFCEKPATFHITELTEPTGPQVMHLCEEHAKGFLHKGASSPMAAITTALAKQLGQLGQSSDDLEELDQKKCPVCGITFREFRNSGRLGCPYDYTHFEADLRPLLVNVHDRTEHVGKSPNRSTNTADSLARMIKLRSEMDQAIKQEDYERASEIRDELKSMATPATPPESETPPSPETDDES